MDSGCGLSVFFVVVGESLGAKGSVVDGAFGGHEGFVEVMAASVGNDHSGINKGFPGFVCNRVAFDQGNDGAVGVILDDEFAGGGSGVACGVIGCLFEKDGGFCSGGEVRWREVDGDISVHGVCSSGSRFNVSKSGCEVEGVVTE